MRYLLFERGLIIWSTLEIQRRIWKRSHICCAISNSKDVQVSSKKAWLTDRFDEDLFS